MEKTITINNIMGGVSPSKYFTGDGQFMKSIAIDPDMPATDSEYDPSGFLRPTSMAKFSGTNVAGVPLWIVPNRVNERIHVVTQNGEVHALAYSSTVIGYSAKIKTIADGGHGATHYNAYLFVARSGDISRFDINAGTWLDKYWTSALAQTAMGNPTMPTIGGVEMPGHCMVNHVPDGNMYILDYQSNIGYVHKMDLSTAGADEGSDYKALDFGLYMRPSDVDSWGEYLVTGLINGTSTSVIQYPAILALWDTVSDSWNDITPDDFHDPIISAVKNINGQIFIASGDTTKGCKIWRMVGIKNLELIASYPDSPPPLPGALEGLVTRLYWGGGISDPESAGVVFSYGSRHKLPLGVHVPYRAPSGTLVTALKHALQSTNIKSPIIGYKDGTSYGLARITSTYGDYNVWQSPMYRVGDEFSIKEVTIPLRQAIANNMTFTVKFYDLQGNQLAKAGSSYTATVNYTNYPGYKEIKLKPVVTGHNGFYMQIDWSGSVLATLALPITIKLDV